MVVAWHIFPVGDAPVRSVTHLPEQQSLCHLHTTPPSRHVGATVGIAVGGSVGCWQLFPVEDVESGLQTPLQHDDIHRHSSPPARQKVVGADGELVGDALGGAVGAVGAHVALQLFPVLDVSSVLQIPLQQSRCHLHSSLPCRHTGAGVGAAVAGAAVVGAAVVGSSVGAVVGGVGGVGDAVVVVA